MSDDILSWLYDRKVCGLLAGTISTRGFLQLLSIWCFYCCCSSARDFNNGQREGAATNINLTRGSSISSRSSMNTGEVVDEGELGFSPLVRSATDRLLRNYRKELEATIPSPFVDPHQESTTSIMVAQAWAHFDDGRARAELLSIFRGQWENGLVPTVRYADGYEGDFLGGSIIPGPLGWGNASCQSAGAENTSALAALPLHAEAALRIFDMSTRDGEARLWLQNLFPPLFRYHDFLHSKRGDPETGLVYVHHPWETEISPDSPIWPALLRETRDRMANDSSWSPPLIPEDVRSIPGFPGEEAYEAAMFLADCAARLEHVDSDIRRRECPFLLQDVQFNAALVRSDKALLELAGILEATRSGWQSKVYTSEQYDRLTRWAARAESGSAMAHLWSPDDGTFLSRYISTSSVAQNFSEAFLVRPATSSGFSSLLAPGMLHFRANSAIDVALSPGHLSFRCGNYPMPEVECGHNGSSEWPSDDAPEGQDDESSDFGFQGGGGQGRYLFDGFANDGSDGGVDRSSRRKTLTEVIDPNLELGMQERVSGGCGGREGRTAEFGGKEGKGRRVWVFHNYVAERGLKKQSLMGLSVWLANETLSLLDPVTSEGGDFTDEIPVEVFLNQEIGDENGGEEATTVFVFHRAFDSVTGLPVAHSEGNASSLAAAVSVLLLLGDGPDGGNDFPPITHATLFVLVAIELGFSFAMGVSCLVFSLNLVRKLREEVDPSPDQQQQQRDRYRYRRRDAQLSDEDRGGVARGETFGSRRAGGHLNLRRSETVPASTTAADGRGIGSLLRRSASSRMDLYHDSDGDDGDDEKEILESVNMAAVWVGGGATSSPEGRPRADLRINPRRDGYDDGERSDDAVAFYGGLGDAAARHRKRSEQRSSDPDEHFYVPISPTPSAVEGGSRSLEVDASPLPRDPAVGRREYDMGFHQASGRDGGGRAGEDAGVVDGGGSGNREDSDNSGVGVMDILRPFYASLKLW